MSGVQNPLTIPVYSHSLRRKVPHICRSVGFGFRGYICVDFLFRGASAMVSFITLFLYISIWTGAGISHTVGIILYNHCVAVCQPGEQHCSWLSQWFYEMDMNNENSSPTPGGPCRKSVPHDGGTQSLYIIVYHICSSAGLPRSDW